MDLHYLKKIILITLCSLLLSCFGSSASIPTDHYYRLPELQGKKLDNILLKGTLSIKKIITNGIYGERTLIYTDNNNTIKLNRYYYHHWEKSPSTLIQDNLVQYFKTIGVSNNVASYSQNSNPDYILIAELISMHRDMTGNNIKTAISLDIQIYNKSNNSMYLNKRYYSNIVVNSKKLVDTVKAYGVGLNNIYDELINDLEN